MKKLAFAVLSFSIFFSLLSASFTSAQPYGAGSYNQAVPYGSLTSLSIAAGANTALSLTPSTNGTATSGSNLVTVTSTDVAGFKLYLRASTNTSLTNGTSSIPASANVTPAALATNTWGYNTDGSSNYTGITLSDTLLKTYNTSATGGNATTVTYGVKVNLGKASGNYTTAVVYTVVGQTP